MTDLHPSRFRSHSPELIDSLRSRLPEYLAARGVDLRANGTRLTGHCPVHDDKHPSFSVFGDGHERCGCHPCGFQGDVFAVSQWLGRASTFPEAVVDVAATLGVYLPSAPPPFSASRGTLNAGSISNDLSKNNTITTVPSALAPAPAFPPAMKHDDLTPADRALISAARAAFRATDESGDLGAMAMDLNITLPVLRRASGGESGLGCHGGQLAYLYPHGMKVRGAPGARPRFMWVCGSARAPWRMERMSPETRTVYLCEGESDCLSLVGIGLEEDGTSLCVASPGTSFSAAWAPLFAGKDVVICFDKDTAGKAATDRVAGLLHGHAATTRTWNNF